MIHHPEFAAGIMIGILICLLFWAGYCCGILLRSLLQQTGVVGLML
jgi:hypothetical protein